MLFTLLHVRVTQSTSHVIVAPDLGGVLYLLCGDACLPPCTVFLLKCLLGEGDLCLLNNDLELSLGGGEWEGDLPLHVK